MNFETLGIWFAYAAGWLVLVAIGLAATSSAAEEDFKYRALNEGSLRAGLRSPYYCSFGVACISHSALLLATCGSSAT